MGDGGWGIRVGGGGVAGDAKRCYKIPNLIIEIEGRCKKRSGTFY